MCCARVCVCVCVCESKLCVVCELVLFRHGFGHNTHKNNLVGGVCVFFFQERELGVFTCIICLGSCHPVVQSVFTFIIP